MTIEQRPLTYSEAQWLSAEMKLTPLIIGYRANELLTMPGCWVAVAGGQLAGCCLTKRLGRGWTTVALLFVPRQFRGRGYGRRLATATIRDEQRAGQRIFCASANPVVIKWMETNGLLTRRHPFILPPFILWRLLTTYLHPYRLAESVRKIFRYGPRRFTYGVTPATG